MGSGSPRECTREFAWDAGDGNARNARHVKYADVDASLGIMLNQFDEQVTRNIRDQESHSLLAFELKRTCHVKVVRIFGFLGLVEIVLIFGITTRYALWNVLELRLFCAQFHKLL
jgi:hypothetical protein